jgi:hypothetical protein
MIPECGARRVEDGQALWEMGTTYGSWFAAGLRIFPSRLLTILRSSSLCTAVLLC